MSVNSVGVKALVARVMDRYDRNNDGAVNLQGNDGAFQVSDTSEKVVTNNQQYDSGALINDGYGNTWWTPRVSKSQIDLGALFVAADTNKDGKASRDEVEALVTTYDADKSGRLEQNELSNLQGDFPEKKSSQDLASPWHWASGNTYAAYEGDYPIRDNPGTDNRFNVASLASVYDLQQYQ